MRIKSSLCLLALACVPALAQYRRTARLNFAQPNTSGVSSWYGKREQGKRMANGQPFDRNSYTAASLTYKLGTVVRVTYPATGAFVTVVITDRGPWIKGRVLDLSERAATTLGLKSHGLGSVVIEPLQLQWHESDEHILELTPAVSHVLQ